MISVITLSALMCYIGNDMYRLSCKIIHQYKIMLCESIL